MPQLLHFLQCPLVGCWIPSHIVASLDVLQPGFMYILNPDNSYFHIFPQQEIPGLEFRVTQEMSEGGGDGDGGTGVFHISWNGFPVSGSWQSGFSDFRVIPTKNTAWNYMALEPISCRAEQRLNYLLGRKIRALRRPGRSGGFLPVLGPLSTLWAETEDTHGKGDLVVYSVI